MLRLVRRGRAHFDPALLVHEGLIADGETPVSRRGLLRHERGLPLDEQMKKEIAYARLKAEQRIGARQKAVAAQIGVQPAGLFLPHLSLEPLFPVRLGGLRPRGDRRDLFADDRSHAPPVLSRAQGRGRARRPLRGGGADRAA